MAESTMTDDVQIIIVQKLWTEMKLNCSADCKVKNLKWKIYDILKSCPAYQRISPEDQRLFFEGIELDDPDSRLEDYGVDSQLSPSSSALHYFRIWLLERYNGIPQTYFLDQAIFDHKWDRSFENIARPVNARLPLRGGRPYTPPLGCVRYGVKVLGKYQNETWLGGKGLRPDEEWPVAYHGTKEVNVMDILRNGFDLEKGYRFAFGRGIYCTPDPKVALGYAYEYDFIDNQFQDMPFKLIIQCRVDPKKLNSGVGDDGVWLVSDGSAIRPYGICVYPAELANKMVTMPD